MHELCICGHPEWAHTAIHCRTCDCSDYQAESDFQYDAEDHKAWTQIKRRVGLRQKVPRS